MLNKNHFCTILVTRCWRCHIGTPWCASSLDPIQVLCTPLSPAWSKIITCLFYIFVFVFKLCTPLSPAWSKIISCLFCNCGFCSNRILLHFPILVSQSVKYNFLSFSMFLSLSSNSAHTVACGFPWNSSWFVCPTYLPPPCPSCRRTQACLRP